MAQDQPAIQNFIKRDLTYRPIDWHNSDTAPQGAEGKQHPTCKGNGYTDVSFMSVHAFHVMSIASMCMQDIQPWNCAHLLCIQIHVTHWTHHMLEA